jgi:hypothetical protein
MAERIDVGPFRRGDTIPFNLTFKDGNDDPISMAGRALWLTVKLSTEEADSAAAFQTTVTPAVDDVDALAGRLNIYIPHSISKTFLPTSYVYDIQVVDTATPEDQVYTYLYGKLKIAADVTASV